MKILAAEECGDMDLQRLVDTNCEGIDFGNQKPDLVALTEDESAAAAVLLSGGDGGFSIVTDKDHRRKGLAYALLGEFIARYKDQFTADGTEYLYAHVRNHTTIPMLESYGFCRDMSESKIIYVIPLQETYDEFYARGN